MPSTSSILALLGLHAPVGMPVQVAAIERNERCRAGIERVDVRREDLALAGHGDGVEIGRERIDVIHHCRAREGRRRYHSGEVEIEEARREPALPDGSPGADAVAEGE